MLAWGLCPESGPTLWGHFFRKKRGPGVKKHTRQVAHLMHQEMNSFSCNVHTGGGVEDGTRDGNFRQSSHLRRSPGSCLTAPMYRPRSRQHSEAVTASSVADSSMFASRSGAPFPRSGQRRVDRIVVCFHFELADFFHCEDPKMMTCDQNTALFVGPGSCLMGPRGGLGKACKRQKSYPPAVFFEENA